MGAKLSLRSKSFLRWQWPSLTAPTPLWSIFMPLQGRRWCMRVNGEDGKREPEKWDTVSCFSGSGAHLTVVVFLITVSYILIGLLFFFSFISLFLPFFPSFEARTKARAFSLAFVRTNFWPKQGSFLASALHESGTFFLTTVSRKEIN